MALLHKISDRLEKVLIIICGVCLISGTLMMLAEVSVRYVAAVSIFWAEEFVRFVNIWFVFLLVGPLAKRAGHLRVTALFNRYSQAIRKHLTVFYSALNIIICILLVWWGVKLTHLLLEMGVKSVTGSVFHPWLWRLSIPVSMAIAVFFLIEYLLSPFKGESS